MSERRARRPAGLAIVSLAALPSCGGGSAGPVESLGAGGVGLAAVGEFVAKPSGELFLVDPSEGGRASELRIEEMAQGRLVDVYDVSPGGAERLWFEDFLVGENVQSDGISWRVEFSPVTQRTALVVLRENDPERSDDEFDQLLREAEESARPVFTKAVVDLPPYSVLPRNGAMMLRFSDAIDASTVTPQSVKVTVGSPPVEPFEARVFADANHGALVAEDGAVVFRPTRVIVDFTISELEAEQAESPLSPNGLGLPASRVQNESNVALRLPTRVDFASGHFVRLENPAGHGLSPSEELNGPTDATVGSVDTVRAMRSGGDEDQNRGYLVDLERPVLVGEQRIRIDAATEEEGDALEPGLEFRVDVRFESIPCALRPLAGNVLQLPVGRFSVEEEGAAPVAGSVPGLRVRSLTGPTTASSLVGAGSFLAVYDPDGGHRPECFVQLVPPPKLPPTSGLSPDLQLRLRFSEPMAPESITAFDSLMVASTNAEPGVRDVVSGRISTSPDLRTFTWIPSLPLPHTKGVSETYYLRMNGGFDEIFDLAGNPLGETLDLVPFTLGHLEDTQPSRNYVLRFGSRDEDLNGDYDVDGNLIGSRPEIRGQFLYDLDRGRVRPRPVSRFRAVVDPSQPLIAVMNTFPPGVQTPLSPMGSRLMQVWRYCDFSFDLLDETVINIDVEGILWAPRNGAVVSDRFEEFKIRLGHSHRFPDEYVLPGISTVLPESGLKRGQWDTPGQNLIDDPDGAMVVVHPQEKGYVVDPVDLTKAESGTLLLPYPMNSDPDPETHVTYTWRDTSLLALGGPDGNGAPPGAMENAGLISGAEQGYYPRNQIPTVALPLLMEYSCYPSDTGIGLNAFSVSLANQLLGKPHFRMFSTGGVNPSGDVVNKDPDLQKKPTGGFNPGAGGAKTPPADPVVYHGALDLVVRVSRIHTIWIDASGPAEWLDGVIEPAAADQPAGTAIVLAYRGAHDRVGHTETCPDDAAAYDVYGDADLRHPCWTSLFDAVDFFAGERWTESIADLAGAKFLQVRVTFLANTVSHATPELSALALPHRSL